MLFGVNIFSFDAVDSFYKICMAIDMVIYKLIGSMFRIFTILSEARLFSSEVIGQFSRRIYLIVSIVMIFALAYSFLSVIINPEKLTKGDSSPGKMVRNIVISIVLVILVPTAFDYAYGFQNSIVKSNVIGKLVLGSTSKVDMANMSGEFTTTLFEGSYYLTQDYSEIEDLDEENDADEAFMAYKYAEIASKADNNIYAFSETLSYVKTGQIEYNFFICLIIGIFTLYVLVTFVFDIATRAVKLAFLQLFAPVPALLYMVPGKSKILTTWFKEVLSSFFEVFVRIAILFFCVYVISILDRDINRILGFTSVDGFMVRNLCRLLIILGILIFVKQAPQLICDILGIKNTGGLLSLKKRLDDVKDGFKTISAPVTKPIDKIGGAALGVKFARDAYNTGIRSGVKGSKVKSGLATFHGLRNGFNNGIRNAGTAYDYEMENQRSYALNSGKSEFEQIKASIYDSLRDNVGRGTRYDDEIKAAEIERDILNRPLDSTIKNIETATGDLITRTDNGHKATMTSNDEASKKFSDMKDQAAKDTEKADSIFTMDGAHIIGNRVTKLNDDIAEARQKNDIVKANALQRELDSITDQTGQIQQYLSQNIKNKNFNKAGLAALEDQLDDSGLDGQSIAVVKSMFSGAKSQMEKDYVNNANSWSTDFKLKMEDYLTYVANNKNIGKYTEYDGTKYVQRDGGSQDFQKLIKHIQTNDIKDMMSANSSNKIDADELFKFGGGIKKTKYHDQSEYNRELSEKVIVRDENGKVLFNDKTAYELKQIKEQAQTQKEANNKKVERLIESRKSEAEANKIRRGHSAKRRGDGK